MPLAAVRRRSSTPRWPPDGPSSTWRSRRTARASCTWPIRMIDEVRALQRAFAGGTSVRVSDDPVSGGDVASFTIAPASDFVFYRGDIADRRRLRALPRHDRRYLQRGRSGERPAGGGRLRRALRRGRFSRTAARRSTTPTRRSTTQCRPLPRRRLSPVRRLRGRRLRALGLERSPALPQDGSANRAQPRPAAPPTKTRLFTSVQGGASGDDRRVESGDLSLADRRLLAPDPAASSR